MRYLFQVALYSFVDDEQGPSRYISKPVTNTKLLQRNPRLQMQLAAT